MSSFRGGSADAVAALTEAVESSYSTAPKTAAKVADDLFAVASSLRSEGALRRFLTDASVPVEARTGLVTEIFGPSIDKGSLALLTDAVSRRWTGARDLADGLEQLSVVATVWSAGTGAKASQLADEIFAVGQAVKDNPELRDALSDPVRSHADKAVLLDTLLGAKALPATVSLAKQSLSGAYRTVSAALEDYEKIASSVHGQGVATVRVARPLSDAEAVRLGKALTEQYGRPVHLNVLIDPDVLGGIRVEVGDDVIDGTVASRLDDARRKLAG